MDSRLSRLAELNKQLNPAKDLEGVFLPDGSKEQFDLMFLAEMPSMNVPEGWVEGQPIPNFGETARDRFLQEMMIKYEVAGSYVTDIVKTRDVPRRPRPDEIARWLPFLLKEIEIIGPRGLVVIGKRTYDGSFRPFVEQHVPKHIKVDWVFHYSTQVPRAKFEGRFRDVIGDLTGKDVKRIERERKRVKPDPMLDEIGEAEAATHDARRQIEALRELLALIRDRIDLPEDIAAKIDAALRK